MEIATLAATAVTYLVTSLKNSKGGKNAIDELSTGLWGWVRPLFLKDDEPLNDLEKEPDNELNQNEIQNKIHKYLTKNPTAVSELENILTKIKNTNPISNTISIVQTNKFGDNIGRDKYGN